MAERNSPSIGLLSQRSLFFVFLITSILFILSWLFVLRSTDNSGSIDHGLLPNPKLFAAIDNGNTEPETLSGGNEPSNIEGNVETHSVRDLVNCDGNKVVLKVFMYDLPSEFHFELLDWKPRGKSVWPDIRTKVPDYPGGLNLQHSIEYWLTLDLLYSEFAEHTSARTAIRVYNSSEADIVFVPFFSSLCYNRFSRVKPHQRSSQNKLLQDKLVAYLTAQEQWKRSGGRDHVILAHHPNSLLDARMKLWPAMFILSDFGRYPPNVANVDKDVIAPYKHVIRTFFNDSSTFDSRPTLLYFQGAIYRKDGGFVRQELFYLLKDEKDVHFSFGSIQKDGISSATHGMHSSKFCLNIAGDTPSSNRLFDAIASHCVPVIISDEIELPYEDILDYSEFCIFVRASDAIRERFLINLMRGIKKEEWTRMWRKLIEIEKFFEYQYPSKEEDAVQMIWQAVARKVPSIRRKIHKSMRFSHYQAPKQRLSKPLPLPSKFSE